MTCSLCRGNLTIPVRPEDCGWVHLYGKVWRKPDGEKYEFPPKTREALVVECFRCSPNYLAWPSPLSLH